MEIIISNVINGIFILLAYTLGLKNGQKLSKNENIELHKNPIKEYKENKISRELEKEQNEDITRLNNILKNIDSYDGTSDGQEEI